jgi:hypothetical protein
MIQTPINCHSRVSETRLDAENVIARKKSDPLPGNLQEKSATLFVRPQVDAGHKVNRPALSGRRLMQDTKSTGLPCQAAG